MKRLATLPSHEQPLPKLSEMVYRGWWQCGRCKHIGEPDTITDPQDIAPPHRVCAECGYHFVKFHGPVLAE